METMTVMFAVGLVSFLLLYLMFKIDGSKHQHLRLFTVIFVVVFMMLIPRAALEDQNCEFLLNSTVTANSYDINDTLIAVHVNNTYTEYCQEKSTTAVTMYRHYINYIRVYAAYWFIAFIIFLWDYIQKNKDMLYKKLK